MGNACSRANANANADTATTRGMSVMEWLRHIAPAATEVAMWQPTRSCNNANVAGNATYRLYYVAREAHLQHTKRMRTSLERFLCQKVCKQQLTYSNIVDSMSEYCSLLLCTRASIADMLERGHNSNDKDMLKNIVGFCLCEAQPPNVLSVHVLCSHCRQGGAILHALEQLALDQQQRTFGQTYNTITLTSTDSAMGFYRKMGYSSVPGHDPHFMAKNLLGEQSAGAKRMAALRHVVTRVRDKRPEVLLTSTLSPSAFMHRCCMIEAHSRGRFMLRASMNYGEASNKQGKKPAAILIVQGTAARCAFQVDVVNGLSALPKVLAWVWHALHPSGASYNAINTHMAAHGCAVQWPAFAASALWLLKKEASRLPPEFERAFNHAFA